MEVEEINKRAVVNRVVARVAVVVLLVDVGQTGIGTEAEMDRGETTMTIRVVDSTRIYMDPMVTPQTVVVLPVEAETVDPLAKGVIVEAEEADAAITKVRLLTNTKESCYKSESTKLTET